jgi:hypothetical protein
MKKLTIEHVIRRILTEQSAESETYNWKVPVVIKPNLSAGGSGKSESLDVGAVFTFRVKARATKTDGRVASKADVQTAIQNSINESSILQPYLTGNFMFIRSADQRDAQRNYLYNFWVVPKAYVEDILWVYTDKISKVNDEELGRFNDALGLPSHGATSLTIDSNADTLMLKNKTLGVTVNEIISRINLEPLSDVIDLPYVDSKRYARAYRWISELRSLNARVDSTDLISPDALNKKIPNETQVVALPIRIDSKSIFYIDDEKFGNLSLEFTGTFNVKTSTPVSGKLTDIISDQPVFNGTLKSTGKPSTAGLQNTFGYSVLTDMDLDTGTAKDLVVSLDPEFGTPAIKTNDKITYHFPSAKFTGTIQNGKLSSGQLVALDSEVNAMYDGDFKNNKFYNGVLSENGKPVSRYRNGIETDYVVYEGSVTTTSSEYYIRTLQLEMITMFEFNKEFFKDFAIVNDINKFIQRGPTGVWDGLMESLTQFIAVVANWIAYKVDLMEPKYATAYEASKTIVKAGLHQWIIQHQTTIIKDTPEPSVEPR